MWPKESFFFLSLQTLRLPTSDLICDGALTCSSITLQWKQYHRNQEVGRLGVTSHVHGNDLKKHIFCLVKFCITEVLDGAPWCFFRPSSRPVSYCPFTSLVWYLGTAQRRREPNCAVFDDALEGSRMVQVRFPQSALSQFPSDFKKAYKQIPAEPIWQALL